MIDICTVVFEEEIPLLQVQAESIARYCSNIGVRNIYVVLNDVETLAEKINPAWWGPMSKHVLVIPRTAFSTPWVENGWLSQQLFKLLAASMSYQPWTMVLDAKTTFVRDLELRTVIDFTGKVATGWCPIPEVFMPAKQIVNDFFKIDLQHVIGPAGVPFFFHNDTVRAMISDVSFITNESFPLWFQKQGMLTEFILYSAYVVYKYGSLDVLVHDKNKLGNIVNVCHSEVDNFDNKLTLMRDLETLTVSVHRGAWNKLTPEQRTAYQMLLLDRNIGSAFNLK